MRDEYVGDIGDFGKYILLNELWKIAEPGTVIGINWYYNNRPSPAFRYLSDRNSLQYQAMNPFMFNRLREFHARRYPQLSDVESADILSGFVFYREPIYSPTEGAKHRDRWFYNSLRVLGNAAIIFLDPDNGIAPPGKTRSEPDAVQYAFVQEEISRYYTENQMSVIVYQHANRMKKKDGGSLRWFSEELDKLSPYKPPILLRCSRYSSRYYGLVAVNDDHHKSFMKLVSTLMSQYSRLFERA